MNRASSDTIVPDIEWLLAVERELVPEPDDVRNRAIRRARASVPRILQLRPTTSVPSRPPRLKLGRAAAAAVVLTSLCAAAFYTGYQIKTHASSSPAPVLTAPRPVVAPKSSVAPPESVPVVQQEPVTLTPPPGRAKSAASAKISAEEDAYAMELRVLQPAQQAVARQDFVSALATIREHQRRFPSGKLAEEREALRVKALLGLGRFQEARRAGAAFRTHFPHSALLGRIDAMLGKQQ